MGCVSTKDNEITTINIDSKESNMKQQIKDNLDNDLHSKRIKKEFIREYQKYKLD
jgi:hypothetical protein